MSENSNREKNPQKQPTLHVYKEYGWLRGLNVIPSWGARIEEAWWFYDPDRFREEIALAKQIHSNCIRLWIEFTAWMADPDTVLASFLDAVDAIDECGMKTMPCLFNRWHDVRWDYGGTYWENITQQLEPHLEYVHAIVTPLISDDRILIWDLCNEPSETKANTAEYHWLEKIAAQVRACGARQPVTIGTDGNNQNIDVYAPLSDVLCSHPYSHTPEQLERDHLIYRQAQNKHQKPLLCNECVPGCLDDQRRAECARFSIDALEAAGWGWMGWGMREGKAVSTRRDRYDANGLDGQGFHAWFNRDGTLRRGLEFLTQPPNQRAPWLT